jgi:hypothetical protein
MAPEEIGRRHDEEIKAALMSRCRLRKDAGKKVNRGGAWL